MLNSVWIIGCALLLFLAGGFVIIPLLQFKKTAVGIFCALLLLVMIVYATWGGWREISLYKQKQQQQLRAKIIMHKLGSVDELIQQVKQRVEHNPQQVKGWYLLGRLYMSKKQWPLAFSAMDHAHKLDPNDMVITINWVQTHWQMNHQKLTAPMQQVLQTLLQQNPDQPDSLAILAMDAYIHHQWAKAIGYWQHLLHNVPSNSKEASELKTLILQAQQKIN